MELSRLILEFVTCKPIVLSPINSKGVFSKILESPRLDTVLFKIIPIELRPLNVMFPLFVNLVPPVAVPGVAKFAKISDTPFRSIVPLFIKSKYLL